jgi:hypothetical protein
MDIKYFGDNFIPGLNVKNINAAVINPLMNAGAAVSQAYGEYGKNLRQALGQEPDDFSKQFLAGKISKVKAPKKTAIIKEFDKLDPKEIEEAIRLSNQSLPVETGNQSLPVETEGPRLDPNATERYASNFKAGQANMGNIQDMYASNKAEDQYKDTGKTALQLWAEANPALAQKEFAKAEAKAVKSGKASSAYDSVETFKPSDIPEADRQNPVEQASALGGNLTKDAQAFKDDAVAALLGNYGNENIKPIVEGITLPTTTDYAGAFNQADIPDLQSVMNMGDNLEKFGYGDLDINPQKFMSSFRGNVIDASKSPETSGLGKTVDLPQVNHLLATLGKDEYFRRLEAGLLTGK